MGFFERILGKREKILSEKELQWQKEIDSFIKSSLKPASGNGGLSIEKVPTKVREIVGKYLKAKELRENVEYWIKKDPYRGGKGGPSDQEWIKRYTEEMNEYVHILREMGCILQEPSPESAKAARGVEESDKKDDRAAPMAAN